MNIFELDKSLFFLINHGTSNAFFDAIMPFITKKGYLLLLPYIFYLLFNAYSENKTKRDCKFNINIVLWSFILAAIAFMLSDWLGSEIKNIVKRIRPCHVFDDVRLLVGCSKSYSMPSNHAANMFSAVTVLYYFTFRNIPFLAAIYSLIIAAIVAFSRVYVGVHYPGDVLVGAFLGVFNAFLVIGLFKIAERHYKKDPYSTLLFSLLFVISIFRIYYILHGPIDLSPDEAHYWEWSRRLDLSYYSKGPMIAYLIYIGTSIFGDNVFGIRIMAVVFSALSSVYLFKLVNIMYAEMPNVKIRQAALLSAMLLQIVPLFSTFGIIFTIDSPFIFFWILSLYLFWKTINNDAAISAILKKEDKHLVRTAHYGLWLLLGICIGLGLLTKYTMAFFYLCGFLFLLFSEKRFILKTIGPYAAAAISIIAFSPVIIWNFNNDWVTIKHTAGHINVAGGLQISFKTLFEFIGSQIGIITPIIFMAMLYALFRLEKIEKGLQAKFLLFFSMPVLGFFLLKSIQSKVQANWAMTGYITGIIALARYYVQKPQRPVRIMLIIGISLALFVTAISHYPSIVRLNPKLDPTARLRGWKTLGEDVSSIYESIRDKGHVFVFSDRYQVASELAFYVKGQPKTYCINLKRRMNQYDLWPDMNQDKDKYPQPANGIFVRIGDSKLPSEVSEAFDTCEKRLLQVYEGKRLLREYSIFICYNFKGLKMQKPETF